MAQPAAQQGAGARADTRRRAPERTEGKTGALVFATALAPWSARTPAHFSSTCARRGRSARPSSAWATVFFGSLAPDPRDHGAGLDQRDRPARADGGGALHEPCGCAHADLGGPHRERSALRWRCCVSVLGRPDLPGAPRWLRRGHHRGRRGSGAGRDRRHPRGGRERVAANGAPRRGAGPERRHAWRASSSASSRERWSSFKVDGRTGPWVIAYGAIAYAVFFGLGGAAMIGFFCVGQAPDEARGRRRGLRLRRDHRCVLRRCRRASASPSSGSAATSSTSSCA
jgi:hypothetical protein